MPLFVMNFRSMVCVGTIGLLGVIGTEVKRSKSVV